VANIKRLRAKMLEKGMNVEDLAKVIDKDRATFYRKLSSDGDSFTIKEANLIVDALKLNSKEATAIFFD
jgi:hypothetical protein